MNKPLSVTNQVRLLMQARKISQNQLAKAAGISSSSLGQWLNQRPTKGDSKTVSINTGTLLRIAAHLKADIRITPQDMRVLREGKKQCGK